jgi:hypothetical protein
MTSPSFHESNVTIDFTGRSYFQLSQCPGYKAICNNGLKEMDVGWLEPGTKGKPDKLYLLEVKDFGIDTLVGRKGYMYPSYKEKSYIYY